MSLDVRNALEHPWFYRAFQAPWLNTKVAPFVTRAGSRLASDTKVLDLGCGPGTNMKLFSNTNYTGVDIEQRYIRSRPNRLNARFVCCDALEFVRSNNDTFDLIFMNSLLHHLPDETVRGIFHEIPKLLSPNGSVHIIDLILPEKRSISRSLALLDRGDHPRPLPEWKVLLSQGLEFIDFKEFPIQFGPMTLWNLFYAEGTKSK